MLSKFVDSLTHFADRWSKASQRVENMLLNYDPELRDSTEDTDPSLTPAENHEEVRRQAALEEENRKRQYYHENKWIVTDDSLGRTPILSYTGDLMDLDFTSFLRYVLKRYGAHTQWTHPFARNVAIVQIQQLVNITRLLLLDAYPQAPEVVKHLLDQIGGLEISNDLAPQVLLDTFSIPSCTIYYQFEDPDSSTAYASIPLFDAFIEEYVLYDLDEANEIQARFEARRLPVPDKLTSENIGTIATVLPEFSQPATRLLDTLMIRCAHYLLSRGLTEDLNLVPTAIFHMVQGLDWGRSYFVQHLIPDSITFQVVNDHLTLSHLSGSDLNQWLTPDYVYENAYTRYSLSELDAYYDPLEVGDLEALEVMICQTLSPEGNHTWRSWQAQEAPFSLTKGLGALYQHILSHVHHTHGRSLTGLDLNLITFFTLRDAIQSEMLAHPEDHYQDEFTQGVHAPAGHWYDGHGALDKIQPSQKPSINIHYSPLNLLIDAHLAHGTPRLMALYQGLDPAGGPDLTITLDHIKNS